MADKQLANKDPEAKSTPSPNSGTFENVPMENALNASCITLLREPEIYILGEEPAAESGMSGNRGGIHFVLSQDEATQTNPMGVGTLASAPNSGGWEPGRGTQDFGNGGMVPIQNGFTFFGEGGTSTTGAYQDTVRMVDDMFRHMNCVEAGIPEDETYIRAYAQANSLDVDSARANVYYSGKLAGLTSMAMGMLTGKDHSFGPKQKPVKKVNMRASPETKMGQSTSKTPSPPNKRPPFCPFCKKIGRPDYATHDLHDQDNGGTTCPYLRTYVCKFCGATGDKAHTASYCPVAATKKGDQ